MKRIRFVRALLAALLALVFVGCGQDQSTSEPGMPGPAGGGVTQEDSGARAPGQAPEDQAPGDEDRLIIRQQTLRLQVESTTDAVDDVRELVRLHSGTITNMQVATDTDEWLYRYDEQGQRAGDGAALRGWLTVRVPAESLEEFVGDVGELGTIVYQSESTDDVTQEHVDLSARLDNLRAQEARLRQLVESATDVEDVLLVEKELWRIRGEIESLDAQVQYLERQAEQATVTIELTEDKPVVRPDGPSWGFVEAFTDGIQGAAQVLAFVIAFVLASSPLWLAGLLVFFLVRRARRRRRASLATEGRAPEPRTKATRRPGGSRAASETRPLADTPPATDMPPATDTPTATDTRPATDTPPATDALSTDTTPADSEPDEASPGDEASGRS